MTVLVAIAPAMAKGKKKNDEEGDKTKAGVVGKLVSISDSEITVKGKKGEKSYQVNDETKYQDKDGGESTAEAAEDFNVVKLEIGEDEVVTMVTEVSKADKKEKPEKEKKEKKEKKGNKEKKEKTEE